MKAPTVGIAEASAELDVPSNPAARVTSWSLCCAKGILRVHESHAIPCRCAETGIPSPSRTAPHLTASAVCSLAYTAVRRHHFLLILLLFLLASARITFTNSTNQGTNAGKCSQHVSDHQTSCHSPNKPAWQAGSFQAVGAS